jgi:hypothetical protein
VSLAGEVQLQTQGSNPFAITVTIAHYPTGASKWNPIEHRLFSEISKKLGGGATRRYEKTLRWRTQLTPVTPRCSVAFRGGLPAKSRAVP